MKIADSYIKWTTRKYIDIPNHKRADAFTLNVHTGQLLYLGIVPAEHCTEMRDKCFFKRI